MIKNSTLNKLIQFIYGETSTLEKLEIEFAIDEDEVLRQSYLDMYNSYKQIPKVKFYPSKGIVANILDYNRNSALNPSL